MELAGTCGRKPGGGYSLEEIDRGLHHVALCAGKTRRAHRELKAEGVDIPRNTLEAWKRRHAAHYQDIRERVLGEIHARMAQESEDLAREYAEAEQQTLREYRRKLGELRPHEAASAVRNLATGRGIATDKAALIRGRPTEIVEHRSVEEILRKWEARGLVTVDSTAEETKGDPSLPRGGEGCPIELCRTGGSRHALPDPRQALPGRFRCDAVKRSSQVLNLEGRAPISDRATVGEATGLWSGTA